MGSAASAPPPGLRRRRSSRLPAIGPLGRLGRYTATHFRVVLAAWLVVAVVLGFFAVRVETALSGAGWEATGSQSVAARQLIDKNFQGLGSYGLMTVVYSPTPTVLAAPSRRGSRTSSARCAPTPPSGPCSRPRRACRSPATATPRSSRPARRATRTRWSAPPTA